RSLTCRAPGCESGDRERGAEPEAALGPRTGVELTAVDGDALPHADEAVPALDAAAAASSVVADGQFDAAVAVAHDDLRILGPRVLDCVRQTFLDEPVRGEVDAGGELHWVALDPELDRQPSLAGLRDEPLDVLEARLRRERRPLLGTAQDSDKAPHLRQRLTARLLDDLERLALPLLFGPEQAAHSGSLDGHDADAVSDDVV